MAESYDDPEAVRRMTEQFESRRRYERRPQSSADLISKLIASRGFSQEIFNDELQQAWQNVVGSSFTGKTQATIVQRGALQVTVDSSPALQQLGFNKTKLLADIQTALPDAGIRSLKFRVGAIRM